MKQNIDAIPPAADSSKPLSHPSNQSHITGGKMKRIVFSMLSLILMTVSIFALGGQSTEKAVASKSDTQIESCISDRLARSEKLRQQGFSVSVSEGTATLTGKAVNAGSKGAATRIARSCGATTVKNEIEAPPIPRPKKSTK